jgi:hypothetical protein
MVFVGAGVVSDGANMVQHQSGSPILACQKATLSARLVRGSEVDTVENAAYLARGFPQIEISLNKEDS